MSDKVTIDTFLNKAQKADLKREMISEIRDYLRDELREEARGMAEKIGESLKPEMAALIRAEFEKEMPKLVKRTRFSIHVPDYY